MKVDLFSHQFKKILKIWPMFIPVFALNKGSSLYQEADFDICLQKLAQEIKFGVDK